jgi:hypothetical protein
MESKMVQTVKNEAKRIKAKQNATKWSPLGQNAVIPRKRIETERNSEKCLINGAKSIKMDHNVVERIKT